MHEHSRASHAAAVWKMQDKEKMNTLAIPQEYSSIRRDGVTFKACKTDNASSCMRSTKAGTTTFQSLACVSAKKHEA
jgi:hypothetical protein